MNHEDLGGGFDRGLYSFEQSEPIPTYGGILNNLHQESVEINRYGKAPHMIKQRLGDSFRMHTKTADFIRTPGIEKMSVPSNYKKADPKFRANTVPSGWDAPGEAMNRVKRKPCRILGMAAKPSKAMFEVTNVGMFMVPEEKFLGDSRILQNGDQSTEKDYANDNYFKPVLF